METLVFSLRRRTIPVSLENEQGIKEDFILQEISGEDRDAYLTLTANRVKFGANGEASGITSFEGLQSTLISMSLIRKEDGKNVSKDLIKKYPSSVQTALFKEAQKLSGLEKMTEAQEEAKNG